MLPRRIAMLACCVLIAGATISSAAEADEPADGACATASPSAVVCVGAEKASEAAAAGCRSTAAPSSTCATATPFGRDVDPKRLAEYQSSWLHRAAAFQSALGDSVPLRDAQWLGTHNSYNAVANGATVSHGDSNQQLTLTQQLDGDIRSLELDVHFVGGVLRVCHARPASEGHAGCTNEDDLATVLAEIEAWIKANPREILLLYLEDHIGDAGYAKALATLDAALPGRIHKPAAASTEGCTELPLGLTRRAVRDAGRQVVLVGKCRAGWSSHVFGWTSANQVEAGNSTGYSCTKPFGAEDYATRMVRFFEDGTWLATGLAPQENMAANRARRLTPEKVSLMVRCGVNLLGIDHFDPWDGRVAASIWSWAEGQPTAAEGCTTQRAEDGRWTSVDCTGARPAACRAPSGWVLTGPVNAAAAAQRCSALGAMFDPPRTGQENEALRALAAGAAPWLAA